MFEKYVKVKKITNRGSNNDNKKITGLLTIIILNLTSCRCTSKRTNIIVEGYYSRIDSRNQLISCDLFVKQISENKF